MSKVPELHVKWAESPMRSPEDAIYEFLFYVEQTIDAEGWDAQPFLGVVSVSELGGTFALSLQVPQMEDEFYEEFESAMAELANLAFTAEIMNNAEEQAFLESGVEKGYEGWLFCAEFNTRELDPETGKAIGSIFEQRFVILANVENHKFGVARIRGADEAVKIDQIPDMPLVRSLSLLNAASLMSLVRRDLDPDM